MAVVLILALAMYSYSGCEGGGEERPSDKPADETLYGRLLAMEWTGCEWGYQETLETLKGMRDEVEGRISKEPFFPKSIEIMESWKGRQSHLIRTKGGAARKRAKA